MLTAVSASDALMLGFEIKTLPLVSQITFVFNLFMGGLTIGTSILAAQYYGKGDMDSIKKFVLIIINLYEVIKVPAAVLHYKKYSWLKNITR